jgi:hypothetical protein
MVDEIEDHTIEKGFIAAEGYNNGHFQGPFNFNPDFIWAPTFYVFHVREGYPMTIDNWGENIGILPELEDTTYALSLMFLLPFPNPQLGLFKEDRIILKNGFVSKDKSPKVLNDASMLFDEIIVRTDIFDEGIFRVKNAYEAELQQIPTRIYDWARRDYPIHKTNVNNLDGRIMLSPEAAGEATAWAIRMLERNKTTLVSSTEFKYLPSNDKHSCF